MKNWTKLSIFLIVLSVFIVIMFILGYIFVMNLSDKFINFMTNLPVTQSLIVGGFVSLLTWINKKYSKG